MSSPMITEKMIEALRTIASQHLYAEMNDEAQMCADFEGGYDSLIAVARAALAAQDQEPVQAVIVGYLDKHSGRYMPKWVWETFDEVSRVKDYTPLYRHPPVQGVEIVPNDTTTKEPSLAEYFERQIGWSTETFGPALRTKGVIDHIRKELREIEQKPHDLSEWIDVVILAMDGFWRHGGNASDLLPALIAKQQKNMARIWPDWRTMSEDSAIEHDRSKDALSKSSEGGETP